jgi:YggT family protein
MEAILQQLTEPLMAPIRRILPPMGGLDLSAMLLIIAIIFLQRLLGL